MDYQPVLDALTVIGVNALAAALIIGVSLAWKWLKAQDDYATVVTLVKAAEQMFPKAAGEDRLLWVLDQAEALVPQLHYETVRALVEAAVFEMNRGKQP